ncbi:unnamed protein product, partial [Discosporangium mesarthrocarpum]
SFGLSVQFVEIYNDKIHDLLNIGSEPGTFRVREHPQTGPYIENLKPVEVETWGQMVKLLAVGVAARQQADTPENQKSSRGHAILTLEVRTDAGVSRVQMIDLAGSERELHKTGRRDGDGNPVGGPALSQQLRETAQIKKALSNLGVIVTALSRGVKVVGLPFRDSMLTWLLKASFLGDGQATTMLATISPLHDNYVETMSTLKYAERLRRSNTHRLLRVGPEPSIDTAQEGIDKIVAQLGAEGRQAKRQARDRVLYQLVADPQQRIAKLTGHVRQHRKPSS